jgi:hypothetical protein
MSSRQETGGGSPRGERNAPRKRRPPWGNLLDGKPIQRQTWVFDEKLDLGDDFVLQLQHLKMLRLKNHYGIFGGDFDYPIKGVAPSDWVPWYKLALAIASQLDDSLKIVDAKPRAQTAARWRGVDGRALLSMVEACRDAYPHRSEQWCLDRLYKAIPALRKTPWKQLLVRYHEAKKHFGATKRRRNSKAAS